MKELIRDKNGIISIFILIFIPLFIITMVGVSEIARSNLSSINLQNAIDCALRACASRIDEESQANGNIKIDPIKADEAFRYELARNLGLDAELKPLDNSSIAESPAYQLVIINGTNRYMPEGYMFTYDSGYSAVEIPTGDLPVYCGVSDNGINVGGDGTHQTTLEAPGCVAVVKIKAKAVLTGDYENIRWGAARIKVK